VRLFPQFRQAHPAAAAELVADHGNLRAMLGDLSVGLDLHLTRADMVERFVVVLRSHAAREDALLYRWAQANEARTDQASQASMPNAGPRL
jgi:hypothetical protein